MAVLLATSSSHWHGMAELGRLQSENGGTFPCSQYWKMARCVGTQS
jgi:hypothetical protein